MTAAYTVSEFIALLNSRIVGLQAEVVGEVSEVKISAKGHVYPTLKDKDTGHILPCTIWKMNYALSGVELEVGMEVMVKGHPEFYGPFGKMSFQAKTAELVGEGALKKAYDKLKKKLASMGMFEEERKRPLPLFPKQIGVITSTHGSVIHDFTSNLRKTGSHVKILHCPVEGPESGRSLALSVRALREEGLDVLVLIRGGGSIQSLAGFDNEALVREIAKFPAPVIVGIGHHKDVPLAALIADASESTPSLVAKRLGLAWEQMEKQLDRHQVRMFTSYSTALKSEDTAEQAQQKIFTAYESMMDNAQSVLSSTFEKAELSFAEILEAYDTAVNAIHDGTEKVSSRISGLLEDMNSSAVLILNSFEECLNWIKSEYLVRIPSEIRQAYGRAVRDAGTRLRNLERLLEANSPEKQLRLGYSIAFSNGKVIKSTKDVEVGDSVEVKVSDGAFLSEVKDVK